MSEQPTVPDAPQFSAKGDQDETQAKGRTNTISPLPGEAGLPDVAVRRRISVSRKGLLAVGLFLVLLGGASAWGIQAFVASGKKPEDAESKRVSDRPAATTIEPRQLAIPAAPLSSVNAAPTPRIPAIVPTAEETAEPIGVHRTGQTSTGGSHSTVVAPEDAPTLLVSVRPMGSKNSTSSTGLSAVTASATSDPAPSTDEIDPSDPSGMPDPLAATTRNLQAYQHQLQGMLENLSRRTAAAGTNPVEDTNGPQDSVSLGGLAKMGAPSSLAAPGTTTSRVAASMIGDRSLTLPKGTAFTCALKTKVISATSGLVACQVQRNVLSDDGRVLLIERGSHLDGDYRIASVKPGTVRIPIVWTRIRTPHGVVVDLDSPGTGPLGEAGIDGYVDNRWPERIGAALLLSLIDDSVQMVIQDKASGNGSNGQATTVVLPSTTSNANKLAEKVLDSTINIPPLIYQNQGGVVGIVVAHDIDFSSVYALRPSAREDGSAAPAQSASDPAR